MIGETKSEQKNNHMTGETKSARDTNATIT